MLDMLAGALIFSYVVAGVHFLRFWRRTGDRLFAQATGQRAFELFAKAPWTFFAKVTPMEIVFESNETASPALTLKQAGRTMRAARE